MKIIELRQISNVTPIVLFFLLAALETSPAFGRQTNSTATKPALENTTTVKKTANATKIDQVIILRNLTVTQNGVSYEFKKDQIVNVSRRKDNFAWLIEPASGKSVQLDDRMFRTYLAPPQDSKPTPTLGIDVQPVRRKRLPGSPTGLRVREVFAGGVGHRMGLRPLDIIVAVNDQPVATLDDYKRSAPLRGDGHVVLGVYRLGRRLELDSRTLLPEQPTVHPDPATGTSLAIRGVMDRSTGLFRITFVGQGAGRTLGLKKGFSLFKINGVEIHEADDVANLERIAQGKFKIEGEDQLGNPFLVHN